MRGCGPGAVPLLLQTWLDWGRSRGANQPIRIDEHPSLAALLMKTHRQLGKKPLRLSGRHTWLRGTSAWGVASRTGGGLAPLGIAIWCMDSKASSTKIQQLNSRSLPPCLISLRSSLLSSGRLNVLACYRQARQYSACAEGLCTKLQPLKARCSGKTVNNQLN